MAAADAGGEQFGRYLLRDLIGKKIVGEFDVADGIMGLGTF